MAEQSILLEGIGPGTTMEQLQQRMTDGGRFSLDQMRIKYDQGASTAKVMYFIYREYVQELIDKRSVKINGHMITIQPNIEKPKPSTSSNTDRKQKVASVGTPSGQELHQGTSNDNIHPDFNSSTDAFTHINRLPDLMETKSTYVRDAFNIRSPNIAAFLTMNGNGKIIKELENHHNVMVILEPGFTKCRKIGQNYTIYIAKADLMNYPCDAIVDARKDSNMLDCIHTPNTFLVDIVDWRDGNWGEEGILREQIQGALTKFGSKQMHSIALSALGTDTHGYPLCRSLETILKAIIDFYDENRNYDWHTDIFLVDRDQWVVDIMYQVLTKTANTATIETFPSSESTSFDSKKKKVPTATLR